MADQQLNRRDFLKAAAAVGVTAAIPRGLKAAETDGRKQPNIILIMADDLGYECIGANGGTSYQTPVLDALAETGIRFENCHSQPVCTPSRVEIMTGMYNVRNYVRFGLMDRNQTTFAHLLKEKGYATCVVGKWQLGREPGSPRHFGFDESCLWNHTGPSNRYPNPGLAVNGKWVWYRNGEYGPDVVSDYACQFMERHRQEPFFVYYPMILTHWPFEPTPDSADWDPKSRRPKTDWDPNRGSKAPRGEPKYFGDMVTYMDKMVGKLTAKLDELGVRDNTLVLFTGDNGSARPLVSMMNGRLVEGGKGSMTDAGTRAPLIAHWPGVTPRGRVSNDLVDFSDFLPTLCDVAGASVPSALDIDGRSFLPQLLGKKGNPRDWIYSWHSSDGGPKGREWARNQRYKLYRTGRFYDVGNDVLEKRPLNDLTPETRQIRDMLQKALDRYKDARPAEMSARGKKQF